MRKELFNECLVLAASPVTTVITQAIIEMIHMLRGTEMTHIVQIDKYLLKKYSELNETKLLRTTKDAFAGAVQYLKGLPEGTQMYARLLYPKSVSSMLTRARFELPAAAATACAQFENSTFTNYYIYISDNSQVRSVIEKVTLYGEQRARLFSISAGDYDSSHMGATEIDKFFAKGSCTIRL